MTLTIVPPPCGRNASSAAVRDISSVPPMLSRVTARQPFGSIASAGTKYWPPALLTSTSRRPQRSSAKRTMRSASSASRTSPATACAPSSAAVSLEHLAPAAGDHDLGTAGPQLRRRGAAEAGAAAGDERDAAVEHPGGEDLEDTRAQRIGPGYGAAVDGESMESWASQASISRRSRIPIRYTYAQIEQACKVAAALGRGKLILAEPPRR